MEEGKKEIFERGNYTIKQNFTMEIHSKYLIHWTGKDILSQPNESYKETSHLSALLARVASCLDYGLFMNRSHEVLTDTRNIDFKFFLHRVCFTELRLSLSQKHASRYGCIGIGFERNFVLQNFGQPVAYVPLNYGPYVNYFAELNESINTNKIIEREQIGGLPRLSHFNSLLSFLKNMNEKDNQEKFENYDELEWRIIGYPQLEDANRIKKEKIAGIPFDKKNHDSYNYRLLFNPTDVKILIVPDHSFITNLLNSAHFRSFFKNYSPMIVSLDGIENF